MSGLSWYKSINGSNTVSNSHYWDWQDQTASITVSSLPVLLLPAVIFPRLISFSVQNIDADPDANLFLYLGNFAVNDPPSLISYIGHNMINLELSGKLTGYTSGGSMKVNIKFALRVDL